MVKVEGEDHFLYTDDELAAYLKQEEKDQPQEPEKKEALKKDAGRAEKGKEPAAKPEEKVRGPQYIEFYEAREIEKIIEKVEKLDVDVEDYEQPSELIKDKDSKKPKYMAKRESGPRSFTCLKEALQYVMEVGKEGMHVQRYKGLGEMNPHQLWETTMDPERRTMLRVTLEDAVEADAMFTVLMGEAVEPRREFIEKHAHEVKVLDI